MIKRLQRRFIAIAMCSLLAILVVIVAVVNGVNYYSAAERADSMLAMLAESEGEFPESLFEPRDRRDDAPQLPKGGNFERMTPETPFQTRFFTVRLDEHGAPSGTNLAHIAAIDADEALALAVEVCAKGDTRGYIEHYRYLVAEEGYGRTILFLDCNTELQNALSVLLVTLGAAAGTLAVMFVLLALLSRRAIRPTVESIEKQKRFITDASHEIKTPLAIIAANTEVLKLTAGESEWTESIEHQVSRLGDLVSGLIELSRMDEDAPAAAHTEFSLSDAVLETAEGFRALAEQRGLTLELSVAHGVEMNGYETGVRRLVSAVIENAVKYSSDGGNIAVTLEKRGKNACIEVTNPTDNMPDDLDAIFDRFYRADPSRARESGGYGIGLSVARAVAAAHRGKIVARKLSNNIISFVITLPN